MGSREGFGGIGWVHPAEGKQKKGGKRELPAELGILRRFKGCRVGKLGTN